jgi:hypothetical protein
VCLILISEELSAVELLGCLNYGTPMLLLGDCTVDF